MQRRRIAVAAAVVVAAGTAVAFTLPSMAGTTPSRSSKAAKADGTSQLFAAMQRDLGLDSKQAEARLKRSKWASGVSSKLSAQTGSDFGGSWLAEDGNTLKVAVTDKDAADEVRDAGAVPVMVERSEQTLVTAKEKLDALKSDADGVTRWYVDVKTNKLVLVAKTGADDAARKLAKEAGLDRDMYTVATSSAQPKPLADARGADAYFIQVGGGTARCSIGFAVEGGFVTAGHCGKVGAQTGGPETPNDLGEAPGNIEAQGVVKASVFPGNADMGFVEVTGDFTPRPVINDFQGNELPVAGSEETPVGGAICRSGSTTGLRCGTIKAKNQTVNYPEGTVTGLTATDVCAEGGDSGGPWFSGDQAQGVTSGGAGDCGENIKQAETFFQPLNEILAANNLTLLTTGGDGGDNGNGDEGNGAGNGDQGNGGDNGAGNGDEGNGAGNGTGEVAAACNNLAAERDGELPRAGTGQIQPDNGAFRANAGQQTACLSASDGADFDLVLQRLTNRGFRTVASATGEGDKQLVFNGRSGTYRYVVVASSGAGTYKLGFSAP